MASGFGKIPSEGDFVRFHMNSDGARAFERWVEEGVMEAHGRWGQAWQSAFDAGSPHGFVYRASSEELLIGVMVPSRDSVGRRYPFVSFQSIGARDVRTAAHVLMLASGEVLEGFSALCANLQGHDRHTLGRDLAQLPGLTVGSLNAAANEYAAWAMQTPVLNAFGVTFSDPLPGAAYALDVLFQCTEPWRGTEQPKTPLSARLPLGSGGPAAGALWIDVVRRISRWQHTVPTHFWRWDGSSGTLLVQLGDTPASSFPELWVHDPNSDVVCDLVLDGRGPPASNLARVSPAAAHVLGAHGACVGHLLDALWR